MLHQRAGREPVDRVFHALADPSRRLIVERLSRGPASVSELAQPLPMSLPADNKKNYELKLRDLVDFVFEKCAAMPSIYVAARRLAQTDRL